MCNNHSFHTHAKRDPTRTLTTRKRFESDIVRRFKNLRKRIYQQIIEFQGFGPLNEPIRNRGQFDFPRSDEKVAAFMDWLRQTQQAGDIDLVIPETSRISAVDRRWANVYIDSAYQQGIRRARAELKKQGVDTMDTTDPAQALAGFNNPIHADRVGLIYTRVYSDLKGITDEMDKQISRTLAQGIAEGLNPREMARQIAERVDKIGITRARALARTETVRAHHQANIQEFKNAGIEEVEIVAEFVTAADPCPVCESLGGNIYTIEAAEGLIPVHPNCFIAGTNVAASKVEATTERRFNGDGVTVRTASGKEFTCTPNHPILTDSGWVAAGSLNKSHYAVCGFLGDVMPSHCSDDYDIVTTIEKVADSVWSPVGVAAVEVETSAPDFHGDGIDGDVAIIRSDSILADWGEAAFDEHIEHLLFKPRIKSTDRGFAGSSFAKLVKRSFSSSGCVMRFFNLSFTLGRRHLLPFKRLCLRLIPDMAFMLFKKAAHNISFYAKMLSGFIFRNSAGVHRNNLFLGKLESGSASSFDSGFFESRLNYLMSDTKLASQISDCSPGGVFFDKVVNVDIVPINAHVYNLQTESSAYLAEGIISHNCRCVAVPILREDVDKRKIRKAA